MLKIFGKFVATWLTAFSIAGATVWAGAGDDAGDAEGAVAEDGSIAVAAPSLRGDAAD